MEEAAGEEFATTRGADFGVVTGASDFLGGWDMRLSKRDL